MTAHVHAAAALTPDERSRLGRRAQLLAGASVTYNVLEAVIAITAGVVAGSVALVGFGLDSVVEGSSGAIILWQFRHRLPESREQQALRLMALSFFALAAYVSFESVRALLGDNQPADSPVGIAMAAASLVIMPFLSWAQRRTGKALGSNAVVADSTQTLLCTYLSGVLLVGLVLNATLGWSWADPIAGLVIAAVAVKEGRDAWRGEGCCSPTQHHDHSAEQPACGCTDDPSDCTDGCCTTDDSPQSQVPSTATLLDLTPRDRQTGP
jgi:divalent metal cation (Fe/Co/Zn/Cd) transporter